MAPIAALTFAGSMLLGVIAAPVAQAPEDPSIREAVERYYKALELEDVEAYMALWSKAAERPHPVSLKFLFDSADDRFFDIEILRAVPSAGQVRVRVSVRRERTRPAQGADPPVVTSSMGISALTFIREGGEWKILSEGSPAHDLAAAYVAAATPEQREAVLAGEPDLVSTELVIALARIASQAGMRQQYSRAEVLFEHVVDLAKRTGSRKEEGEALQNLGNALYFQRKLPEALLRYEQRLAIEEERADEVAVASALTGIATIRYSLAEYSEALRRYLQALAIHERRDDRPSTALTLISTGNVRYLQGDYPNAIRDYSRSRDLYRAFLNPEGEADALGGLGRTYSAQGDYASALSAFSGVLAIGRAHANRLRQASATQHLGDVHLRLGNVDMARQQYETSRDHFLAVKHTHSAGRVWQGLGMTELLAGRYDAAEHAYRTSISLCDGFPDPECSAHATVGLGFSQYAQDNFADAIASYRKGADALLELGAREPAARAEVGLSQALTGSKEFAAAIAAATRARHAAMAIDSDDVVWRALTAEARALWQSGATGDALAVARAAAGVVERMHAGAVAKPATAIPADASAALATLAVLQAETGDNAAAWSSASRLRAIALRNALAVNERAVARGMTADEREQERVAASELLSLLAQVSRERGLRKPDAARIAALDERIAQSSAARDQWMQQLYQRIPDLRLWRGMSPPPTLTDLVPVLTPGTVILDFIVDDESVLAVLVAATADAAVSTHTTTIRRRVLLERVNALLQQNTLRDPVGWRKAASELTRLLPVHVTDTLRAASRIIVVPHDVIWRVPFEALPIGDEYLGDGREVVYAGSAGALVSAAPLQPRASPALLGIGAPELTSSTVERLQQSAPGWAIRTADAGLRETGLLAGVYGQDATILTGAQATESAVRSASAAHSTLHVAAPFRVNGASPLFSPILLSGDAAGEAAEDDGALEAREVMNLNLRSRLAVFSDGAATSMRDAAASADIVHWAWLAAGTPSIVLARWTTDPAASNALLTELHRRLRSGEAPGTALLEARRVVRANREWAAPFYWAGWMMLGPSVDWAPWSPWFAPFLRW